MISTSAEQVLDRLPEHLAGIAELDWSLWRWVCVRGAGFPAADTLKLNATSATLSELEALFALQKELDIRWMDAYSWANQALDDLRIHGGWDDKKKRSGLLKMRDKLKSREMPRSEAFDASAEATELTAALARMKATMEDYRKALTGSVIAVSGALEEVVAQPRFREAVTWQNRAAIHTALNHLRPMAPNSARGSRRRQHEELVASYIQRYSLKNDTIGFFGPVGWARFLADSENLELRPGNNLLATRRVYFEHWPIEALAKVIAEDRNVYPWLAPITSPFIRVSGTTLHHPIFGAINITPGRAALIKLCTGRISARDLARKFMALPGGLVKSEAQFYQEIADLEAKQILFWGFTIPLHAYPERILRQALERIEDRAVRGKALGLLHQLESARDKVQESGSDPEILDAAMGDLEATFTRLTGIPATRNHGVTYGGRTLIYEDCRRDLEVDLGPHFLRVLVEPLSLLLTSARWLTANVANIYRRKLEETYDALAAEKNDPAVDASRFWTRVMADMNVGEGEQWDQLMEEFQRKWDEILSPNQVLTRMEYTCAELKPIVDAAFPAAAAGWKFARYHSPDVMIVAPSVEAIQRDEYSLVLGELHVGGNTLKPFLFVNQHPAPEELIHAVESDIGIPRIIPVAPLKEIEILARTASALTSQHDIFLEYARESFALDRARALPISSLIVERRDGVLTAFTRDGKLQFDAIELVAGRLSDMVQDSFRLLKPRAHSPRISIDRLIVKRETWRVSASTLEFAWKQDEAERFLGCWIWRRTLQLPERVFFKVPTEKKPSFVDFRSPILTDMFCKMIRRTCEAGIADPVIQMTEMVPDGESLWLVDKEGNRYTSELRLIAVDLKRDVSPGTMETPMDTKAETISAVCSPKSRGPVPSTP